MNFEDKYNEYIDAIEERIQMIPDIDPKTGKMIQRWRTDQKGWKIVTDKATGRKKEVRQTSSEKAKRSKAAKKSAMKRKLQPKSFKKKTPSWLTRRKKSMLKFVKK